MERAIGPELDSEKLGARREAELEASRHENCVWASWRCRSKQETAAPWQPGERPGWGFEGTTQAVANEQPFSSQGQEPWANY